MRILIVDDEAFIREGVQRTILKEFPYLHVNTVENGEQALAYLNSHAVDIVFLDMMMPGMNGIETLQKARAICADISWIVISAHSDFSFAQQALRLGAKDYLLKPIGKNKLIELVQELISKRQEEKQTQNKHETHLQYVREAVIQRWIAKLDTSAFDQTVFLPDTCLYKLILVKLEDELDVEIRHFIAENVTSDWLKDKGNGFAVSIGKHAVLAVIEAELCTAKQMEKLEAGLKLCLKERYRMQQSPEPVRASVLSQEVVRMSTALEMAHLPDAEQEDGANRAIEMAVQYIQNHFSQNELSLEKVAREVYLNAAYFSLLFKQTQKIGYKEYVTRLRMEKAKELLIGSALKIANVAEQVGYHDMRHFTQVFRKHVNMTPSEYRSQLQATANR